jgi:hypothetical protein
MVLFEMDGGKKSIHSWITNTKSGPKNVMALTTTVPILGRTRDDHKKKPAVLKRYDFSMGGTDRVDQLGQRYCVRWKSCRWTMSPSKSHLVFSNLSANLLNRSLLPQT